MLCTHFLSSPLAAMLSQKIPCFSNSILQQDLSSQALLANLQAIIKVLLSTRGVWMLQSFYSIPATSYCKSSLLPDCSNQGTQLHTKSYGKYCRPAVPYCFGWWCSPVSQLDLSCNMQRFQRLWLIKKEIYSFVPLCVLHTCSLLFCSICIQMWQCYQHKVDITPSEAA